MQTRFGWQVILLDDLRERTQPAFDDVKDRSNVLVTNQQLVQHIQQLLKLRRLS